VKVPSHGTQEDGTKDPFTPIEPIGVKAVEFWRGWRSRTSVALAATAAGLSQSSTRLNTSFARPSAVCHTRNDESIPQRVLANGLELLDQTERLHPKVIVLQRVHRGVPHRLRPADEPLSHRTNTPMISRTHRQCS
jgi:hypothetical protein